MKIDQRKIIDMFDFEWNEREERETLLKVGEARGEARGEERGKTEATTLNIKNLMKSMHLSPEDAMKALGIAPSEFGRYLALL